MSELLSTRVRVLPRSTSPPPVEKDDDDAKKQVSNNDPPPEANVLISSAVLVCAVVLDALTALPVSDGSNVPSSLRTSCMTLVALAAANPLDPNYGLEQRGAVALLLAAVSFLGSHHASSYIRTSDAAFVLVTGLASTALFARGGIEKDDSKIPCFRRSSAIMFCAGLFFYVGARLFRNAVTMAGEVQAFTIEGSEFDSRGYAYASATSAAAIGFAAAAAVACAILIFMSATRIGLQGCEAVAHATILVACATFTAALIANYEQFLSSLTLPALYGPNSCTGAREACVAAYRSRRFNAASLSCTGPFAITIALATFSYPKGVRFATPTEMFDYAADTTWSIAGAAVTAFLVLIVFVYTADASFVVDWSSLTLILSIVAVYIAAFWSTSVAGLVQLFAMSTNLVISVENLGIGVYIQFVTNLSFLVTFALITVFTLTSIGSYIMWILQKKSAPWLEFFTGVTIVAATSTQFGLFLTTMGLMASYDGSLIIDERPVVEQASQWVLHHFLPFFFLAAVLSSRVEASQLSATIFRAAWGIPVVLVAIVWAVALSATHSGSPYGELADVGSLVVGTVAGLAPWALCASLLPLQ